MIDDRSGLTTPTDDVFTMLRPRLVRLAYRMLGTVADAEDIVHDAYLRWVAVEKQDIRAPAAFLNTIVTRLCINEINSARRKRETYMGPWLPEPILEEEASEVEVGDLTFHLMMVLDRLSPLERAAFLLHDVFGLTFEEIAESIGRDPAACRKLASRARRNVQAARPRFPVSRELGASIASAFFVASRSGDVDALRDLLSEDVVAYADGGGQVSASGQALTGLDKVLFCHKFLAAEFVRQPSRLLRFTTIDGLPGFITIEGGGILQTTALHIECGLIRSIYVVRNPEKLRQVNRQIVSGGDENPTFGFPSAVSTNWLYCA